MITDAPRRGLFARLGGIMALGAAASAARAEPADGPNWPGPLGARHRQVTDAYAIHGGFPLYYTVAFLEPNKGTAAAVVILRHEAFPIALNHAMWDKYKIGETLKITDPGTKAIATRNPFLTPEPGALQNDAAAIDRMLGAGVVFGACNVALHGLARRLAPIAGVSADEAAAEFAANVVPGVTVIPSGTWGVNRAQEAGCTYCAGG